MTTTLHQLTADDVRYCDNRNSNGGLLRTFNENLGEHQMRILHEDGLYRHLRFKNPANGFYWFDLIIWPGNLTITGDIGTYTFARDTDMFTFFTGEINTGYWAEKLQHGSSGGRASVRNYDEELFKKWLVQDFWEYSRDESTKTTSEWWKLLRSEVLDTHFGPDLCSADIAINTMRDLDMPPIIQNHYVEVYEHATAWEQYNWHFELCLAAIVAGIRTYNEHAKTEQLAAKENTK